MSTKASIKDGGMVAKIEAAAFDHGLAERLAGDIIDSTDAHTVMEMLGLERMDLVSEGVTRALRDWPKFDPAKSQPQTFMYPRINAGIFDYLRKEGSQNRRVQEFAAGGRVKIDRDRELADWLKDVYEAAKRTYTAKRYRQGRKFYNIAQLVSLAALMQRESLSCRAVRGFLASREDLQSVIRLPRIPSHMFFSRAMLALSRFKQAQNVVTEAA